MKVLRLPEILPSGFVSFTLGTGCPELSGSPLFPGIPCASALLSDPDGTSTAGLTRLRRRVSIPTLSVARWVPISSLARYAASVLPPLIRRRRLPQQTSFRGSITQLLHSLSTLRAAVTDDYARLTCSWWPAFTAWDSHPQGHVEGFPGYFKRRHFPPPGLVMARRIPKLEETETKVPFSFQ
jgi:hypothetical protein